MNTNTFLQKNVVAVLYVMYAARVYPFERLRRRESRRRGSEWIQIENGKTNLIERRRGKPTNNDGVKIRIRERSHSRGRRRTANKMRDNEMWENARREPTNFGIYKRVVPSKTVKIGVYRRSLSFYNTLGWSGTLPAVIWT